MFKKTLIVFLLVVTILFSFTVNSYASGNNFTFSFKDKKINLPDISYGKNLDDLKYYTCYFDKSKNRHYFFVSSSPMYLIDNVTQYQTLKRGALKIDEGRVFEFVKEGNEDYWRYNIDRDCPMVYKNRVLQQDVFIYSNYDLIYNDEVVNYAFGTTPLLKTMRSINTMDNVTSEIVSILPVILVILVSFIGIRKGIDFIKTHIKNV